MICKNCDEQLIADAHFCQCCGQSVKMFSRPCLEMARELLAETLDWDGRMARSVGLLLTRPGFLSQEYIQGKRVTYTSPVRMYLVISLLFFLVLPMILPPPANVSPDHKQLSVDLYSKGMFVMLPVFALLLKLFYRRVFYWDHLVFTVHLFSVSYIGFAVLLSIETLADRYFFVMVLQVFVLLYMVGYVLMALRRVYAESWPATVLKSIGLLFLFLPALAILIEVASHIGGEAG
jgi:hypothetical protein